MKIVVTLENRFVSWKDTLKWILKATRSSPLLLSVLSSKCTYTNHFVVSSTVSDRKILKLFVSTLRYKNKNDVLLRPTFGPLTHLILRCRAVAFPNRLPPAPQSCFVRESEYTSKNQYCVPWFNFFLQSHPSKPSSFIIIFGSIIAAVSVVRWGYPNLIKITDQINTFHTPLLNIAELLNCRVGTWKSWILHCVSLKVCPCSPTDSHHLVIVIRILNTTQKTMSFGDKGDSGLNVRVRYFGILWKEKERKIALWPVCPLALCLETTLIW